MSATVSSDFGLYKETTNQKKCINDWTYGCLGLGALCLLFLITLFAIVSTNLHIQKFNNNLSTTPQRYFGSESTILIKGEPRPFQINFDGPQPTTFVVTSTERPLIGVKYYDLNPYRRRNVPGSIQEIIGHITPNDTKKKMRHDLVSNKHQIAGSNYQENVTNQGFKKNDPFQEFKPLQPGEINLMALANFRFSPPVWKSFSSKYQRDTLAQQFIASSEESFNPSSGNRNKPISFTFSVLPTEQATKNLMHFLREMESRIRKSRNHMMTIHVNVDAKTQNID